ncbi:hypothetical protein N7510_006255 [Penicillium lagena]|uniref:uncharacterized protein n=1 Tax=Penicillium lagena TaxID=94218 RepID=UPI00253F7CEE|nr:uncharacterized protein N7510_006255 [Penicillium lagena]KAJ5613061.1 hypothetical protein N7510_006255 [Penicillium lagena]
MGVESTTSVDPFLLSAVISGNWGYYTESVTSGTGAWNATLASYDLMAKFYTAFSSACASPTISATAVTTTMQLLTFSNLPDGAKGSITTTTETVTQYGCNPSAVPVMSWTVQDSGSISGLDPSGTLYATVAKSQFTLANLDAWLWLLAFRFAHLTVGTLAYGKVTHQSGRGPALSYDYPFFNVPRLIQLIYKDDINTELEQINIQMTWKDADSNTLLCEILVSIMMALVSFIQPEGDALLESFGIEVSDEAKALINKGIQKGIKAGGKSLRMGCVGESENSFG